MKTLCRHSKFNAAKNSIATALFPNRCPYCRKVIEPQEYACSQCRKKLPTMVYHRFALGGTPCSAALPYQDEYADAVKRYKFGKKASFARPLAVVMFRAAQESFDLDRFDVVTWVPMRRQEKRRRRFDHAELLAQELATMAGLPCDELLEKYKKNRPQHSLKRSEREQNVRGVYRVPDKSLVKNKRILLVDDIITTGSTLGECVRMLRRAGCRYADCAVVCATVV